MTHLLLLPESEETDTRDLDDLETDTGNITLGLAATTETRDEDFVVLIDKVQAAVILAGHRYQHYAPVSQQTKGETYGDEGGDLLAVLDELHTDTLPDGRVGLLGLNTDLLEHNALSVRRASRWGGLVEVAEGALLVGLVRLLCV